MWLCQCGMRARPSGGGMVFVRSKSRHASLWRVVYLVCLSKSGMLVVAGRCRERAWRAGVGHLCSGAAGGRVGGARACFAGRVRHAFWAFPESLCCLPLAPDGRLNSARYLEARSFVKWEKWGKFSSSLAARQPQHLPVLAEPLPHPGLALSRENFVSMAAQLDKEERQQARLIDELAFDNSEISPSDFQ
ncbi:hypothetical protein HAX54_048296 [Datura stramonium]|uniref:Uncharacterized protein n=1 Tax=Datura stramonium TaxID=4076 RepID=A0ABS8STV3_DATST|nr:hypothetical protein [Datura stramonium]